MTVLYKESKYTVLQLNFFQYFVNSKGKLANNETILKNVGFFHEPHFSLLLYGI